RTTQRSYRLPDPAPSILPARPLRGQLVAPTVPELFILSGVGLFGLGEDLGGKIILVAVSEERCVRRDLRPIDSHQPRIDKTGRHTQRQDLPEQPRDRLLMVASEPSQRRVIRLLVDRQHTIRDILDQPSLDPPRRTLPGAV